MPHFKNDGTGRAGIRRSGLLQSSVSPFLKKNTVPHTKAKHRPELPAVVTAFLQMLLQKRLQPFPPEIQAGGLSRKSLPQPSFPFLRTHPMANRHGKAQLRPVTGINIQVAGRRFPQDIFRRSVLLLHHGGQTASQGKDIPVQKGHPHFQGMGHTHAIRFLEDILDALKRDGVSENQEAFRRVKASYDASTAAHTAEIAKIKARLENLFQFAEEAFADGQELLILVTELTVRYYCAKFVSKFGCGAYFKHNQNLLFYQRKQELLTEIADMNL